MVNYILQPGPATDSFTLNKPVDVEVTETIGEDGTAQIRMQYRYRVFKDATIPVTAEGPNKEEALNQAESAMRNRLGTVYSRYVGWKETGPNSFRDTDERLRQELSDLLDPVEES